MNHLSKIYKAPKRFQHLKRLRRKDDFEVLIFAKSYNKISTSDINISINLNIKYGVVEVPIIKPLTMKMCKDWSNKFWPVHPKCIKQENNYDNYFSILIESTKVNLNFKNINEWKSLVLKEDCLVVVVGSSNQLVRKILNNRISCSTTTPLDHIVMKAINEISIEINNYRKTKHRNNKKKIKSNWFDEVNTYLLTGMDVYLNIEPCIMCSMALVHSRVRRVFFNTSLNNKGGLISKQRLHCCKKLNHHFRVFKN